MVDRMSRHSSPVWLDDAIYFATGTGEQKAVTPFQEPGSEF
jgi:hypothetical protein